MSFPDLGVPEFLLNRAGFSSPERSEIMLSRIEARRKSEDLTETSLHDIANGPIGNGISAVVLALQVEVVENSANLLSEQSLLLRTVRCSEFPRGNNQMPGATRTDHAVLRKEESCL